MGYILWLLSSDVWKISVVAGQTLHVSAEGLEEGVVRREEKGDSTNSGWVP